jgi:hypothetical protein
MWNFIGFLCLRLICQISKFLVHAGRVEIFNFQEDPSNGRRDSTEKTSYSSSELPLKLTKTKPPNFATHAWRVRGIKFQENPSDEIRDSTGRA